MFAANISTVHLVSLAQNAYTSGLLYGNYEWMAGFVLILLSLFFAPLYLRTRVSTLPDYLERRYNRNCRDMLSFVSLISAIVIHIGVALFTAATVLCYIFGIPQPQDHFWASTPLMFFIIAHGRADRRLYDYRRSCWRSFGPKACRRSCCCSARSASRSPVTWPWADGTPCSSCWRRIRIPCSDRKAEPELSTKSFLNMMHAANDNTVIDNIPWYSILLGYPVLGIWYWCCDQTIVQRVLAAKDEKNARLGPLFCAFIKILPVFLFVLPGIICVALVQKGYFGMETVDNVERRRWTADLERRLSFHDYAFAAEGFDGLGHRRHAGRGDANLFRGAEFGRHAFYLRYLEAVASEHDGPQPGEYRPLDHGHRHGAGDRAFAAVRPLRHDFQRPERA